MKKDTPAPWQMQLFTPQKICFQAICCYEWQCKERHPLFYSMLWLFTKCNKIKICTFSCNYLRWNIQHQNIFLGWVNSSDHHLGNKISSVLVSFVTIKAMISGKGLSELNLKHDPFIFPLISEGFGDLARTILTTDTDCNVKNCFSWKSEKVNPFLKAKLMNDQSTRFVQSSLLERIRRWEHYLCALGWHSWGSSCGHTCGSVQLGAKIGLTLNSSFNCDAIWWPCFHANIIWCLVSLSPRVEKCFSVELESRNTPAKGVYLFWNAEVLTLKSRRMLATMTLTCDAAAPITPATGLVGVYFGGTPSEHVNSDTSSVFMCALMNSRDLSNAYVSLKQVSRICTPSLMPLRIRLFLLMRSMA